MLADYSAVNKNNQQPEISLNLSGVKIPPYPLSCTVLRKTTKQQRASANATMGGYVSTQITEAKKSQSDTLVITAAELTKLPDAILSLTCLTKLLLSRNKLSTMNLNLESLPNLQDLDLSGNDFAVIPLEVTSLPTLKFLDLSFNEVCARGVSIGAQFEIHSSSRQITCIPMHVSRLSSLETVLLVDNKINSIEDGALYPVFTHTSQKYHTHPHTHPTRSHSTHSTLPHITPYTSTPSTHFANSLHTLHSIHTVNKRTC